MRVTIAIGAVAAAMIMAAVPAWAQAAPRGTRGAGLAADRPQAAHGTHLARRPARDRKVIIIVADTATWGDYTSEHAPFLRHWLRQGAVGLMNTRVQGVPSPAAAYLTLGAGSRASAEQDLSLAELAVNHDERCGDRSGRDLFRARMGRDLREGIGYLGLPSVLAENAQAAYPLRLGLLGEALRNAGLVAAAVGNADGLDSYRRQVVTIVMDETGRVPLGDVGAHSALRAAPSAVPQTDYAALRRAFERVLPRASVIAVETGDLSRLAQASSLFMPAAMARRRLEAVERMDSFVRYVARRMAGHPWRLYLVTPSAMALASQRADVLTPVAVWGEGICPGLLTSPTTRRAGVVANIDLAPTMLRFLLVPVPPEAVGRPMEAASRANGAPLQDLLALQQQQQRLEASRPYVLDRAAVIIVALLALTALLLILAGPASSGLLVTLRAAGLLILAFPLAALVVPAQAFASPALVLLLIAGVTVIAALVARALGHWDAPWAWLAGGFSLALLADTILGGKGLVESSVLGYSVTVGSRYYGLGNEFGGALIAAAPLAIAGGLGSRHPSRGQSAILALALTCVVIILGHPSMGTNLGIAVPAALGFGLTMLGMSSARRKWRHRVIAAVAAAAALVAILVANRLVDAAHQTHIGLALEAARRGGLAEMMEAFSRRMDRNLMLVRHSSATWLLVSALAVLASAAMGRSRALSEVAGERSAFAAALVGASVASAVAFFVNDSGVAAAAWGFVVIAGALMYVVFDWRLRQGGLTREPYVSARPRISEPEPIGPAQERLT
jgi:hypothetical protein